MTSPHAATPTTAEEPRAECGTLVVAPRGEVAHDAAPGTDDEYEEAQRRAMEEARELLPHEPERAVAVLQAALARRPLDPGE